MLLTMTTAPPRDRLLLRPCTWVDRQVGRVIGALERAGLTETTRVIYTSDHGDNIGARGMWGKSTHYDDAAGVPMIVAGPDVPQRPRLPHAGQPRRPRADHHAGGRRGSLRLGESELPGTIAVRYLHRAHDAQRTVFSEYHAFGSPSAAFMLRNGRYKYNYYVGYPPELFDLDADPGEERNLLSDPNFSAIVAGFETQLRDMLDPEATDARAKADQAALIERFGGPQKAMNVGAPGATPAPV